MLELKKDIANVAFQSTNGYIGKKSVLDYSNRLNEFPMYVFSELRCIVSDVFGTNSPAFSDLEKMEESIKISFILVVLICISLNAFILITSLIWTLDL